MNFVINVYVLKEQYPPDSFPASAAAPLAPSAPSDPLTSPPSSHSVIKPISSKNF